MGSGKCAIIMYMYSVLTLPFNDHATTLNTGACIEPLICTEVEKHCERNQALKYLTPFPLMLN